MNHREVIKRFVEGERQGTGHAIWTDGKDLFTKVCASAYRSTPGVIKLHDGSYLVSDHFHHSGLLPHNVEKVYCTQAEMEDYCFRGRPASVIIHRTLEPQSIAQSLIFLVHTAVKEYGYGPRFPGKKIEAVVKDEILWWTVLRDRSAEQSVRFMSIIRAMKEVSDSYLDKVSGEACDVLRCSSYQGKEDIDFEHFIQNIFCVVIDRNLEAKHLRQLSSALKAFLPGYRGLGRADRSVVAVFGDAPFDILSNHSNLKDEWRMIILEMMHKSKFIYNTFDKALLDDLLHEEMINKI